MSLYANEKLEDHNPVGRIYFSASTMICTPASKAQEVGLALGAQASDSRLRDVVMSAGFKSFRRASETPFNRVFEAKLMIVYSFLGFLEKEEEFPG